MAKQLIPEELNALIKEYLTDGVLTSKEREVVLRKAEKMGLDRDEIDLYLDAQVQKIEQETDMAIRRQKGKACPYCGSPVPQLADKCPECNQFITPEASEELEEILENLEDALIEFKSGSDIQKNKAVVERYARKAKLYYNNNPKVQRLLEEIEEDSQKAEKEAREREQKAEKEARKREKDAKNSKRIQNFLKFYENHKKTTIVLVYLAITLSILTCANIWRSVSGSMTQSHVKEVSEKVLNMVNKGDLGEAKSFLSNETEIDYKTHEQYDAVYLSVAKAYIGQENFDSAEEIGLMFRSKSSYYWKDSSTRKYLIKALKEAGRDSSILED